MSDPNVSAYGVTLQVGQFLEASQNLWTMIGLRDLGTHASL